MQSDSHGWENTRARWNELNFIEGVNEAQLMRMVVQAEKDQQGGTDEMAQALATLAGLFLMRERRPMAEPLLERAFAIFSGLHGIHSETSIHVGEHLLRLYEDTSQYVKADELRMCIEVGQLPPAMLKWTLQLPTPDHSPAVSPGTPTFAGAHTLDLRPATSHAQTAMAKLDAINRPGTSPVQPASISLEQLRAGFGVNPAVVSPELAAAKKEKTLHNLSLLTDVRLLDRLRVLEKRADGELDTGRVLVILATRMAASNQHTAAAALLERAVQLFTAGSCSEEAVEALQLLMDVNAQRMAHNAADDVVLLPELLALRAAVEAAEQAKQARDMCHSVNDSRARSSSPARRAAPVDSEQEAATEEDPTPRTELSNAYNDFKRAATPDNSIAARKKVLAARDRVASTKKKLPAEQDDEEQEIPQFHKKRRPSLPPQIPGGTEDSLGRRKSVDAYQPGDGSSVIPVDSVERRPLSLFKTKSILSLFKSKSTLSTTGVTLDSEADATATMADAEEQMRSVTLDSEADATATMADAEEQIRILSEELQREEGVQWDRAAEIILEKDQNINCLQNQVTELQQHVNDTADGSDAHSQMLQALVQQMVALEAQVQESQRSPHRSQRQSVKVHPFQETAGADTTMEKYPAADTKTIFTELSDYNKTSDEHSEEPTTLQEEELGAAFYALSQVYLRRFLYTKCCRGLNAFVIVTLVVTAGVMPVNPSESHNWLVAEEVSWVIYIMAIVYSTIETCVRMYMMGLSAYVQGGCNLLDIVVLAVSWPSIVLSTVHFNIGPLRAVRLLMEFSGVKAIAAVMFNNRWVFANCLLLFFLVLTMFGIIAIEGFDNSYDNWCAYDGQLALPISGCSPDSSSGFHCAQTTTTATQHSCSSGFTRPQNNHASFSNFWSALVLNIELIARGNLPFFINTLRARESNIVLLYPVFLLMVIVFFIKSVFAAAVISATLELAHSRQSEEDSHQEELGTPRSPLMGEPQIGDNQAVVDARAVAEKLRAQGREEEAAAIYEEVAIAEGLFTHECCGLRAKAGFIVRDPMFDHVVLFFVIVNTAILGAQHANQSDLWDDLVFWSEIGFASFFLLEAAFRIFGLGVQCYFADLWNRFDFLIVVLSLVSFIGTDTNVMALRAFRAFRGLRVARVLRTVPSVMGTMRTMFFAASGLIDVCILLVGVVVLVALCGMQLFGKHSDGNERSGTGWGRPNFDTWGSSVLVLVQVLTNDGWEQPMYDLYRTDNSWASAPFFISFWFFSHIILINLFLGVMLQAINRSAAEGNTTLSIQSNDMAAPLQQRLEAYYNKYNATNLDKLPQLVAFYAGNEGPLWSRLDIKYKTSVFGLSPMQQTQLLIFEQEHSFVLEINSNNETDNFLPGCFEKTDGSLCCNLNAASLIRTLCVSLHDSCWFQTATALIAAISCLMVFTDGPASAGSDTFEMVDKHLDQFFLFWWTMECLTGCIAHGFYWTRTDYGENSKYAVSRDRLQQLELVEALERGQTVLEDTPPSTPRAQAQYRTAYMSQRFHKLDFVLLLLSWLDFVLDASSVSWISIGRAVRPLRVLSIVQETGALMEGLIMAASALRNVAVMTVIGVLIFAIMGLQLLCDVLGSCNDSTIDSENACVGFMTQPIVQCATVLPSNTYCGIEEYQLPRAWQTRHRNFDNLGEALLTLFETALSGAGADLLYAMLDADEENHNDRNSAWYMALYYCAFILFTSFMMLQLISAVIIDAYAQSHLSLTGARNASDVNAVDENGDGVLSPEEIKLHAEAIQKDEVQHMQRMVMLVAPFEIPQRPTHSQIRCFCFDMCIPWDERKPYTVGVHYYSHWIRKYFDAVMVLLTIVNIALLATKHEGQPDSWKDFIYYQDCAFLLVFAFEVIVKMIAMLPVIYFRRLAHLFDFLIVFGAVISLAFEGSRIVSAFRALRVVRLALRISGVRGVLLALIPAIRPMLNLLLLLVVFFSMYASIGMHLFSGVQFGVTIGQDYNFESFRSSIYVLWLVAFGDQWSITAEDCARRPPLCTDGKDCGSWLSTPFFVSFVGFVDIVALQLAVAIVLEGYTWLLMMQRGIQGGDTGADSNLIEHLDEFSQHFQKLDHMAQGSIALRDLEQLVISTGPPVGREAPVDPIWLDQIVSQLEALPVHVRGRANFASVWSVLTGQVEYLEGVSRPPSRAPSRAHTPMRLTTPAIGSRPVTRSDVVVSDGWVVPELADDKKEANAAEGKKEATCSAEVLDLEANPLMISKRDEEPSSASASPVRRQSSPRPQAVTIDQFPSAPFDVCIPPASDDEDEDGWDEDEEEDGWQNVREVEHELQGYFGFVPTGSPLSPVIEDHGQATAEELTTEREKMRQSRKNSHKSDMDGLDDDFQWPLEQGPEDAAGLGVLVESDEVRLSAEKLKSAESKEENSSVVDDQNTASDDSAISECSAVAVSTMPALIPKEETQAESDLCERQKMRAARRSIKLTGKR